MIENGTNTTETETKQEMQVDPEVEDIKPVKTEVVKTETDIVDDVDNDPSSENDSKHDIIIENEINNTEPEIKQEMQVDIKIEDLKPVKTEIMKTEDVSKNQSHENNLKTGEKKELLSNTLKRKRCRTRSRRVRNKRNNLERTFTKRIGPNTNAGTLPRSTPETDQSSGDAKMDADSQDDVEYILTVSNIPNTWSFMDIKNYIDKECDPVDEMELLTDKKTGNGAVRLAYQSETECRNTMNKLKDKEIDGHKLTVEMTVETLESDTDEQSENNEKTWKPDMDDWDIDPKGLYGLKEEFLKSLDIQPPLDRWVGVSNFRCDKSQLRDVLEMAGKVLQCSVFMTANKYANVMYSHPLEAVQAVSMLHGQQFYGQTLNLKIIRAPTESLLLPKGLTTIGKGLGIGGKPLRNVKKHYKRLLAEESSLVNPMLFDLPHASDVQVPQVNFEVKSVEVLNKDIENKTKANTETPAQKEKPPKPTPVPKPQSTISTVNRTNIPNATTRPSPTNFPRPNGPFPRPNMARPISPFVPGPGPRPMGAYGPDPRMMRPFGPGNGWNRVPMHGPMNAPMHRPMHGPMPGTVGLMQGTVRPMQGPMPGQMGTMVTTGYNNNEPVQLQLSNLPPSTTFNILCEKMAQCGQVVSIQLTTPGCAVVTFANRIQADQCIKAYNGAFVDGCTLQVKYS